MATIRGRAAWWRSPWTMAAAAFLIRVGAIQLFHTYRFPADHDHYLFGTEMGRIARSLVTGGGFGSPFEGATGPTALVGPIYPFIIAAAFKVLGIYTTAAAAALLALSAAFSAATAAVVYYIGRTAFGERTGVWAGWIWAWFPMDIFWAVIWVWDTALSGLLFAAVFLATLRLAGSQRVADSLWLGALWGLAILTNTTFLLLLPLLVGWMCVRQARRGRMWLPQAAAVLAAFMLVLAPWLVRNYLVFGHVVLRSNFGLELAQGYSPGATVSLRAYRLHPAYNEAERARYRNLGELRYMGEKERVARAYISRNPRNFVRITALHVAYFWFSESPARPLHFPEILLYGLPTVFAWAGTWRAAAVRHPVAFPFLAVAVVFPLVYYVTHPEPRFRYLIDPVLFVPAAWALVAAVQSIEGVFRPGSARLRPPTAIAQEEEGVTPLPPRQNN